MLYISAVDFRNSQAFFNVMYMYHVATYPCTTPLVRLTRDPWFDSRFRSILLIFHVRVTNIAEKYRQLP